VIPAPSATAAAFAVARHTEKGDSNRDDDVEIRRDAPLLRSTRERYACY
jgi:hypothetical protein